MESDECVKREGIERKTWKNFVNNLAPPLSKSFFFFSLFVFLSLNFSFFLYSPICQIFRYFLICVSVTDFKR